jgi:hypothetical protein
MADGGLWAVVQEAQSGPLLTHQLDVRESIRGTYSTCGLQVAVPATGSIFAAKQTSCKARVCLRSMRRDTRAKSQNAPSCSTLSNFTRLRSSLGS